MVKKKKKNILQHAGKCKATKRLKQPSHFFSSHQIFLIVVPTRGLASHCCEKVNHGRYFGVMEADHEVLSYKFLN